MAATLNWVTPAPIIPGAPTIGTVIAGSSQVTVNINAPASDGGSAITGYTVSSLPAGGVDSHAGTTGLSHVITGLSNGTPYTFTVKASNAIGTGAASPASNSVTPATVPDAPLIGKATGGNTSATVTFTEPAFNGGSAITGYTVTSNPGSITVNCVTLPCNISGLTNGTGYTFTVTATNAAGTGLPSAESNIVYPENVTADVHVYYIHADHLNTPRTITDTSGVVVWQWDNSDPFGNNSANENPNGAGQFSFNLRFPGQYFDKETNTHYNINRDYHPATGRYIESDPIGLEGGINTYTYVEGNPLIYVDPLGLDISSFLFGRAGNKLFQAPATAAGKLCAASFSDCKYANSPGGDADATTFCLNSFAKMPPSITRGLPSAYFAECYKVCKDEIAENCKQCPVK